MYIPKIEPKIPFTPQRYAEMKRKVHELLIQQEEVLIRLKTAREMGDLSENGAYRYAKFELGNTRRQLKELNHMIKIGEVLQRYGPSEVVEIGCTVTLTAENKEYQFYLVNEYEADPTKQRISDKSPIGSALLGKKIGDIVKVTLPQKEVTYTITQLT